MDASKNPLNRNNADNLARWARLGIWSWTAARHTTEVDAAFVALFGYTLEELGPDPFHSWVELIHPDDREQLSRLRTELIEGRMDSVDFIYRLKAKDGRWVWLRTRGDVTERDTNGTILEIWGTIQDITEAREAELEKQHRDQLAAVSNDIAQILLDATPADFDNRIWEAFDRLGKASRVDRVYVWRNHLEGDVMQTTQLYEWSPGVEPQQGNALTVGIPVQAVGATWFETLSSGRCINSLVRDLPEPIREHLAAQQILSILVAPILFNGTLWGFVGFDDCSNERVWKDSEITILCSMAMMIASSIKRNIAENALQSERQTLNQIFMSSPIGVVITREDRILHCNARFSELTQLLPGKTIQEMYLESESRQKILNELQEQGEVVNEYMQIKRQDGDLRDILITVRNICFAGQSALASWIADITPLKKTEAELRLARDLAEEATKTKGEFLARMSHEIRTPINAILGMTYLCLQTDLSDKQRDYLDKTHTATTNLLGIIDDILDFSKIEAQRLELEETPFRLSDVLGEVSDLLEIKANEKGLDLSFQIGENVHNNLIGDPLRLRQILTNLLNNAVKFTDQGKILLHVENLSETIDDMDSNTEPRFYRLKFSVQDSGIGMTDNQLERIFAPFTQADGSTTRKYGGTGLGLVISRNLVELMGGQIGVSSEPGVGTTFYFTAVFKRASDLIELKNRIDFAQLRVLVVDDDPTTREILSQYIRSFDMRVETVEHGLAAVEALSSATEENDPFEILLIDWKMPRMDGTETIRRIRKDRNIRVPMQIVMISSFDRNECIRQSRSLGISGFLVKPISRNDLKEAMFYAISENHDVQSNDGKPGGRDDGTKSSIKGARILLVEDNKVNQMVASELLQMLGVELTVANNGLEAIEEVMNKDFDLVLMDVQMPIMDGLEATRKIRELKASEPRRLPVLAMTANAMDSDYQKSLEVGMDDHLTKPINPERLRQALESWIVR